MEKATEEPKLEQPAIHNVVVVSDIHAGSQLGLCPPEGVTLDDGGSYMPSSLQLKMWERWKEFWYDWVPKVTKREPYVIVVNGDLFEGQPFGSKTSITLNTADQAKAGKQIMEPLIKRTKCVGYYQVRGTESHVGKSAENEEEVAKDLGAIPDEFGRHARWEIWMRMPNKTLIHFSHHVGTTQSSAYESTAVYKELVEAFNEAGRWADSPPDCIIRSHRHRQFEVRIATEKGYGISLVTPGWQLKTPFAHRLASARASTPQIGGYLTRTGDEDEIYTRFKVWKLGRPKEVQL